MIDDALQTQAALYALGALPPDEADAFRAQLADVPGLAEIVADYKAAAGGLAESLPVVVPPVSLRARILAAIAEKPTVVESRRTAWLPWALAAGFAFAAGALWFQNQQLETNLAGQRTAWVDLNRQLESANSAAAGRDQFVRDLTAQVDKLRSAETGNLAVITSQRQTIADLQKRNSIAETQVATLTSKLDGSYLASIAWDNSAQAGILHVRRLPAAERGKDYQLWVIDPKSAAPVSAGVFSVQADGSATIKFAPAQKVSSATAFAVSVEKSGGVPAPEGPVVLSN